MCSKKLGGGGEGGEEREKRRIYWFDQIIDMLEIHNTSSFAELYSCLVK